MKFLVLVIVATASLVLESCKTAGRDSKLSSQYRDEDALLSRSESQNYIDSAFDTSCQKLRRINYSLGECNSTLIKAVCDQKASVLDKAIHSLIAKPELSFAFQKITLKSNIGKFLDTRFRKEAAPCFNQLKKIDLESNAAPSSQLQKSSPPIRHWLSQEIADLLLNNSASSKKETDSVNNIFNSISQTICHDGISQLKQRLYNHSTSLDWSSCSVKTSIFKTSYLKDLEDPSLCIRASNSIQHLLKNYDSNNLVALLDNYFTTGIKNACVSQDSIHLCDLTQVAPQIVHQKLKPDVESSRQKCREIIVAAKWLKNKSASLPRYEKRVDSDIKASWYIRPCCHCLVSFFNRNETHGDPNPIHDHNLGTTPVTFSLGDGRLNQNSCSAMNQTQVPAFDSNRKYFNYIYYSDCKQETVVSSKCSFEKGEWYKMIWQSHNKSPSSKRIPSTSKINATSPTFLPLVLPQLLD